MAVEGTINGTLFLGFVKHFLAPTLAPGDIVIMDNLSIHKVSGVAETIAAAGARVLYLPAYSPDFNPIEECWSKVKAFIRSLAPDTPRTFIRALRAALNAVSTYDIAGWFDHAHVEVHSI